MKLRMLPLLRPALAPRRLRKMRKKKRFTITFGTQHLRKITIIPEMEPRWQMNRRDMNIFMKNHQQLHLHQ